MHLNNPHSAVQTKDPPQAILNQLGGSPKKTLQTHKKTLQNTAKNYKTQGNIKLTLKTLHKPYKNAADMSGTYKRKNYSKPTDPHQASPHSYLSSLFFKATQTVSHTDYAKQVFFHIFLYPSKLIMRDRRSNICGGHGLTYLLISHLPQQLSELRQNIFIKSSVFFFISLNSRTLLIADSLISLCCMLLHLITILVLLKLVLILVFIY